MTGSGTTVRGIDRPLRAGRAELRSQVGRSRHLYPLLERTRAGGLTADRLDPRCELVIDGFQSSGNTFVMRAVRSAQSRPRRIAGHLHAAGLVRRSVALGLPTVVLVRPPRDSVASAASRWSGPSLGQWLRMWTRYHAGVGPVLDDILLVTFAEATTDLHGVTVAINRRFRLDLDEFADDAERMQEIYGKDPDGPERADRRVRKAAALEQLDDRRFAALVERADSLHRRLLASRGPHLDGNREP
jgi:hypothetical protein